MAASATCRLVGEALRETGHPGSSCDFLNFYSLANRAARVEPLPEFNKAADAMGAKQTRSFIHIHASAPAGSCVKRPALAGCLRTCTARTADWPCCQEHSPMWEPHQAMPALTQAHAAISGRAFAQVLA